MTAQRATATTDRSADASDDAANGASTSDVGGDDAAIGPDDSSAAADPDDADASPVVATRVEGTRRWKGVTAAALAFGAAGAIYTQPALLLASVLGIAYAAYARISEPPTPVLHVERDLDDENPDPGQQVRVTVRVRNDGGSLVPDLRLVDGVPNELVVTEGVARHGVALRPGETATFAYAVTAQQGTHEFEPLLAIARGFAGNRERIQEIAVDTAVTCTPAEGPKADIPLRSLTTPYAGRVETDVGGDGVEFYSTREYRPGDPISRIDWNQRARTGELTTLTFREERSATVTLVVDTRERAYRRGDPDDRHAVARSVEAAVRILETLLEGGDQVGIASLGPRQCWLRPGSGVDHRVRARELLVTDPAFSPTPPEPSPLVRQYVRRIRTRLPDDSQVILLSPLADDAIVRAARLFDAHGHLVTVVSPDPTNADTPGGQLAAAERALRITALRDWGVRVVDWPADESFAAATERSARRWSG